MPLWLASTRSADWGIGVENLNVDTSGLSAAAASGEAVAVSLMSGEIGELAVPTEARHSGVGIAALDKAVTRVHDRQARRILTHANSLRNASSRYDETDRGGAADIAVTV